MPIETITITGTAIDVSDPAAPGFWQALIDAQGLPFKVVRKP